MLAHNLSSYDDDSFLVAELKKKEEEAVFFAGKWSGS